ncbi:MAG: DUF2779 domain-containing protein, partial [Chlorobi bacterium]|nr:DUF2779 domain-containing protein [Chlorobiota bacterium]
MKNKTPRPRYLTKSRFKIGRECPVKLFYTGKYKYPNVMDDDDFMNSLAEGGHQVGELAKYYYPGGHDITALDYETSLNETNELLKQENVIIYEAAVQVEDFFIRVDVLKKVGDTLHLIEVKAKSIGPEKDQFLNNKGEINGDMKPYLEDVAFQTYVTRKSFPGLTIEPYLMLSDKSQAATVNGLNQRFRIVSNSRGRKSVEIVGDVSLEALGNQLLAEIPVEQYCDMILSDADFLQDIQDFAKNYKLDRRIPSNIKFECKNCEYNFPKKDLQDGQINGYEECWKKELNWKDEDFLKPRVFDIWNFKARKYIESGIYLTEDLDPAEAFSSRDTEEDFFNIHDKQFLQVTNSLSNNDKEEVVHPRLFTEMDSWTYPLHFIDFETTTVAIPFYKGMKPYEMTAFQFSCHTLHKDGTFKHSEWINKEAGKFPNFEFAKALKDVLDKDDGTVFRFAAHENTVLRQIHEQLKIQLISNQYSPIENAEELRDWIDTITKTDEHTGDRNMVDMCDIVKKYYFNAAAKNGSNSIKAVLPAVLSTSKVLEEKYTKPYNS